MSEDKSTELALQLLKLGVSQDGVVELLLQYPHDQIEAQLRYLPYRRAKRKEAFIVEAIRKNYSPPKDILHAQAKAHLAAAIHALDQGSEHPPRLPDALPQGHRAQTPPPFDPPDSGLAAEQPDPDSDLPNFDAENW